MKGARVNYSADELAWIKARADWTRRDLHTAFQAQFGRDDVSLQNLSALCKRRGWLTGRTGRFTPGHAIQNGYGKGTCAPGSEKGWFRRGNRSGRANHLYKAIGTERMTAYGYIERKISDDLPLRNRWRAVHLIRWEETNGPVPKGHALKCLDGDKANTDPANWALVNRAMLPRLAGRRDRGSIGYDAAEPEVRPAIMAIARLEQRARKLKGGGDDA